MSSRADFLKTLMAGIAAAPLAASSATHEHVEHPGIWMEKHWNSGGLQFSEYELPVTMSATFEEVGAGRTMYQMVMVSIFDRDVVNKPLRKIIAGVIEATSRRAEAVRRHGMPIVDEEGNDLNFGNPTDNNHVIIVKVEGHPALMGVTVHPRKLVPIRDYYRDIAKRNNMIKKGMGEMGARNQANEGGWSKHGGGRLKTM